MIHLAPVLSRLKRALAQDQRRPLPVQEPLWRLLVDEVRVLARRVGRTRVIATAVAVMLAVALVETALTDLTPGPVVAAPWRWVVAALVAVVFVAAWALRDALRRAGPDPDD